VTKVTEFDTNGGDRQQEITLTPQYCPDTVPEDQNFSKFTPSGEMKFAVTNPVVIDRFKVGTSYYIDLIPVE
jgi:hypothetical protein